VKKKFLILLCSLCFLPSVVNAYTNNNGVVMTEEQYLDLRKIYSEQHISILEQDRFDELMAMNLDFDNTQETIQYIKVEHNNLTGQTVTSEVTKEEYNNAEPVLTRATVIETTYKRIALHLSKGSSPHAVFSFNAVWKYLPATRSFDVIGTRLSNLKVLNASQQGKQIYILNGVTDYVQYNWNGTNIKNLSNGFGISMNLVNSDVSYLECTIDATLEIEAYPATALASYQHATQDVSLATSQSYTIGAGLGSVFVFSDSVAQKYDGMQGVYDYFSS
jgi:hypothetical protein